MKKELSIAIFILPNTLLSTIFATEEIFSICNEFCKQKKEVTFKTTLVSLEDNLHMIEKDLILPTTCISNHHVYDIIFIPPMRSHDNFNFDIPKLNTWLIKQYHNGAILTSACIGSFFLASTNLLDNKKATTHWAYEKLFEHTFPNVFLHCNEILIDDQNIITTGGVNAYMDLCLYLIERYASTKTANDCANILLIDKKRDSQNSYKTLSPILLGDDNDIKISILWMKDNLQEQITTQLLAQKSNMKERTYLRRFKKIVNSTPINYLQLLRIEKAKELLISTNKSFDEITFEVGFFNESSFRRLFKRETSLNPGVYRKKFQQYL
jgi:transcriptional regulator GlxA family with amidase domain